MSSLAFTGVLMFAINYALLFGENCDVSSGLAAIFAGIDSDFRNEYCVALALAGGTVALAARLLGAFVSIGGVALICARTA